MEVVVFQPASVRVRQDVSVSESLPPQTIIPSMLCQYLLSGRFGSVQCLPVEGTYISTD